MTALLTSLNINIILIIFSFISAVIYIGALAKANRKMQKVLAYNSILLVLLTLSFNFNTNFADSLGIHYYLGSSVDASTQDFSLIEKVLFIVRQFLKLV